MYSYNFYTKIKEDLQNRWRPVSQVSNIVGGKGDKTNIGNIIGMQPHKFGLTVWDWDRQFEKKLRELRRKGGNDYDPMAYKFTRDNFMGIPFQYIESLPMWNKTANWSDVGEIMGRFETQSVYSNSSAQDLTITLNYYAESSDNSGLDGNEKPNSRDTWTLNAIERIKLQLQSITFPQYDGKFSPPVKCLLNIGNIFVDLPVVVKSLTIEEGPPYELRTMRSMFKKITVEMRTSYPAWQALSAPQIWTADNGGVFARQELQYIN